MKHNYKTTRVEKYQFLITNIDFLKPGYFNCPLVQITLGPLVGHSKIEGRGKYTCHHRASIGYSKLQEEAVLFLATNKPFSIIIGLRSVLNNYLKPTLIYSIPLVKC